MLDRATGLCVYVCKRLFAGDHLAVMNLPWQLVVLRVYVYVIDRMGRPPFKLSREKLPQNFKRKFSLRFCVRIQQTPAQDKHIHATAHTHMNHE